MNANVLQHSQACYFYWPSHPSLSDYHDNVRLGVKPISLKSDKMSHFNDVMSHRLFTQPACLKTTPCTLCTTASICLQLPLCATISSSNPQTQGTGLGATLPYTKQKMPVSTFLHCGPLFYTIYILQHPTPLTHIMTKLQIQVRTTFRHYKFVVMYSLYHIK